ncbi:hypothetical protein P4B35_17265 [Pontiellaceae bacterium B12227]|nr:hypothetical protein [Pontiellaceae bacterium B12227]
MKKLAMLLASGFAIGMLTGCGIPEEEHNMIIDGINTEHQKEVDKLKGDIADKETIIKNEKAKVRQNRIELDDATERIQGLQQKSAETSKALASEKSKVAKLESELKTSKSRTAAAQDDAMEAENKYSTLDVEYQELKRRFEMFQKNMSAISEPAPAAAEPAASVMDDFPADTAPQSDAQKASSLLDQMSTF